MYQILFEKMPTFKQGKRFCFTFNNYTEEDEKKLKEELEKNAKYAVYGHEEGEQGTKHLQGFVIWNGNRRPASLKKINEKIHWENAFGTSQQASDYCKKDGKDIFEIGTLPDDIKERNKKNGNANKAKWDLYKKLAIEGKFDEIPSNIYIKNMRNLHLLHDMSFKDKSMEEFGNKDLKDHFLWLWGSTGTGKSTNARRIAKKIESDREPYLKGLNKWWNGYKCQRVTIIEEANPKACEHLAHFFKQWADKWSFPAEIKCSAFDSIRPEYIIVTSNYSIRECFPAEQDYEPLERRFTEIELVQSPLASFTEVDWPKDIGERKSSVTMVTLGASQKEGNVTVSPEPLGNTSNPAVAPKGSASPPHEEHSGSTQELIVSDEDSEIDEDEAIDILIEGRETKRRKVIDD